MARVLVAGVGNIFFGDDGFGPEVARALAAEPIDGVTVEDYGIRGLHLAYALLEGYDRAILIDAMPGDQGPGTLYVVEPDVHAPDGGPADAHRMDVQNVLGFVRALGGAPPAITIVGCEPATIDEGIGLSEPVAAAVPSAAALVRRLISGMQHSTKETTWSEASSSAR